MSVAVRCDRGRRHTWGRVPVGKLHTWHVPRSPCSRTGCVLPASCCHRLPRQSHTGTHAMTATVIAALTGGGTPCKVPNGPMVVGMPPYVCAAFPAHTPPGRTCRITHISPEAYRTRKCVWCVASMGRSA